MKFSPDDLLHQSFERRMRGYDPDQVHEFLQALAREWEQLQSELFSAQAELARQRELARELQGRERGLLDALQLAKGVADELRVKAEREAERLISDARARAEQLTAQAERERERADAALTSLRRQRVQLEQELRGVLGAHLSLLEAPADTPDAPAPSARRRPSPDQATRHTSPTLRVNAPEQTHSRYDEDHGAGDDEDQDYAPPQPHQAVSAMPPPPPE